MDTLKTHLDLDSLNTIKELNLSYLMLAQDLLRKNFYRGLYRLGIKSEVAHALLQLTPPEVIKMASANSLLFEFKLNDPQLIQTLKLSPTHHSEIRDTQNSHHISILLTQRTHQKNRPLGL